MALGSTQPLNRNEYQESLKIKNPGGKLRPERRADNLAAIYLLAVCLSNVGALTSTAFNRDIFTFLLIDLSLSTDIPLLVQRK
jgi:hypothetical protein